MLPDCIGGLTCAGDFTARPPVAFTATAYTLANMNKTAAQLLEEIGVRNKFTAGMSKRAESFDGFLEYAFGEFLFLLCQLLFFS